jgi:hypothetical protein
MTCPIVDTTFNEIVELMNWSCSWTVKSGFNKIYNSDGTLNREGNVTKKFSFRTFWMVGRFIPKRNIGLWMYYYKNVVRNIIIYDTRGLPVERVEFYESGQLKSKEFTFRKRKYVENYLPTGKLIENEDNVWKYFEPQEKNK